MHDKHFSKISFYIVAHADDWQLFMQPNAHKDLISEHTKVIFIVTTAGEAGFDENYWTSREEGSKSSIRFCLAPSATITETSGIRKFNDHDINYWSANNATFYFLRLPDGGLNGHGFSNYDNQSLGKLERGETDNLRAVEKSTTYHTWSDFYETLQTIILFESKEIPQISIHYLNPDTVANPGDHADHVATGRAVQKMPVVSTFKQFLYLGYRVGNVPGDIEKSELFWKVGMFAAYEKAVFDKSGYSTLKESIPTYIKWSLSGARFIVIDEVE